MFALYDNLDRLRAERLLDAAQAASVPHLAENGRRSFYKHAERRARRRLVAQAATAAGGPAPFTVNGTPIGKAGLIRWLGQTFGVGTTVDAARPSVNGDPMGAARRAPGSHGHPNGRGH